MSASVAKTEYITSPSRLLLFPTFSLHHYINSKEENSTVKTI